MHANEVEADARDVVQDLFGGNPLQTLWNHGLQAKRPIHACPCDHFAAGVDDVSALGAERAIWPNRGISSPRLNVSLIGRPPRFAWRLRHLDKLQRVGYQGPT